MVSTKQMSYSSRVKNLINLLNSLSEIDRQIQGEDPTEAHERYWMDIVDVTEEYAGSIGVPIDPHNYNASQRRLTAPAWQGDYIRIAIYWKDDGLFVTSSVMPEIGGPIKAFYDGPLQSLSSEKLEERGKWAKSKDPMSSA